MVASDLSKELPGPGVLGGGVRVVLPTIESAIFVLALVAPIVGLAAATVVLAGLAVAVWFLARQQVTRECNCFGAIAPATIGPRLAARNLILSIVAGVGCYAAWDQDLRSLSLTKVLLTLLVGAVALMLLEYHRLRRAVQTANTSPEEFAA